MDKHKKRIINLCIIVILLLILLSTTAVGVWYACFRKTGWIVNGDSYNIDLEYVPDKACIEKGSAVMVYEYSFSNNEGGISSSKLKSNPKLENIVLTFAYSDLKVTDYSQLQGGEYEDVILNSNESKYVYLIISVIDVKKKASYTDSIEWTTERVVQLTFDMGYAGIQTGYVTANKPLTMNDLPQMPTNVLGCRYSGWYTDKACTNLADLSQGFANPTTIYLKCSYVSTGWINWNGNDGYEIVPGDSIIPTDLIIPENYDDGTNGEASIVGIQDSYGDRGAFTGSNVETVVLPTYLKSVGNCAFYECDTLKSVIIGKNVKEIHSNAFYNCTNLESVVFEKESSLEHIFSYAFNGCDSLTNIELPKSLQKVDEDCFANCTNLKCVTIEEGSLLKNLSGGMFMNCTALESFVIPKSVTSIGYNSYGSSTSNYSAFGDCTSLKSVIYEEGSTMQNSGAYAFVGCTSLESVTFASSIKSIGLNGFQNTGFKELILPSTIQSISSFSFAECDKLTKIEIPSSVTKIEDTSFDQCPVVETIKVALGNEYYTSQNAQGEECNVLVDKQTNVLLLGSRDAIIPLGVTKIDSYAFYGMAVDEITIPSSVKSIGSYAFTNCDNLTSVNIEQSSELTEVGKYAFYNCAKLETISLDKATTISSIGQRAFEGCCSLTAISLSNTIETLGGNVFNGCSLLASVTIPADSLITEIPFNAFYGCSSLESFNISNNVTDVYSGAFQNCEKLVSVNISAKVESISASAFTGCDMLTTIVVDSNNQTYTSRNKTNNECNVIVDIEKTQLVVACKGTTIPDTATIIPSGVFVSCGGTITIPSWVTNVDGGAFYMCKGIESIVVDEENETYTSQDSTGKECNIIINKSSNEVVTGCKNSEIPSTAKSIGVRAFYGAVGLKNLVIPNGVETIRESAFAYCNDLESISIPASVNYIYFGSWAFQYTLNLKTIVVDEGNTVYTSRDLKGNECNAIIEIETGTLYLGCINTTIGDNVKVIGNNAFGGRAIETIIIPEGVEKIAYEAFRGCAGLKSVTIAESVTEVGSGAFGDCILLEEVIFKDASNWKAQGESYYLVLTDPEKVAYMLTTYSYQDSVNGCADSKLIKN